MRKRTKTKSKPSMTDSEPPSQGAFENAPSVPCHKRTVVENKMKQGVYTNKQRGQLVETSLRRPPCGRRVRSWRTENSDFLRGDVRPKSNTDSTNIVRSAKNNPQIDLHPGSLGPMAGMEGQWLSEENLPGNIFQDVEELL